MTDSGDNMGTSRLKGIYVSRKTILYSAVAVIIAAVILALVVHYASVPNETCEKEGDGGGSNSPHGSETAKKITDVRLPLHLMPVSYKVELIPFIIPNNFTIDGFVEIVIKCTQSGSNNITLHIADLSINEGSVRVFEEGSRMDIRVRKHSYDTIREFYIVWLHGRGFVEGRRYVIRMKFISKLTDGLKGFYRSTYFDKSTNKTEILGVTQFQATDARRAFPCFDEPALKATFEISLGRLRNMSSISNMPIKNMAAPMMHTTEYVWDHYEKSVPMSTYLVAFIVSRMEHKSTTIANSNVQFRIWARKDAIDQIGFARDIGPKMLDFFETFFNVSYPLPKQDMIALPDFSAGAMENWGIITYRESALLYKKGTSALSNKQRVAIVVSHELAHQWFGNLVTPYWWTDLWLNEGFASYVEYLGVEAAVPEMRLLEQFVVIDLQTVFSLDGLATSHPVSIPVKHPDEISEIFDRISYAKGASIIRMMDHFLGTPTFRKGLTNYLNAKKYGSATQDDLWQFLTDQADKDDVLPQNLTVKQIMDTWTLQMGFPVLTVTRNYTKEQTGTITQERFLLGEPLKSDTHDYKWWIRITYMPLIPGNKFSKFHLSGWIGPHQQSLEISGLPYNSIPVLFNINQTGYYRVNYDERNWRMIIDTLKVDHELIPVINRAQLLDDAMNLARVGKLDYTVALGITEYLSNEREYVPWNAAIRSLHYISNLLERTSIYGLFKKYMRNLINPLYNRQGFNGQDSDGYLTVSLRKLAVSNACYFGVADCRERSSNVFKEWMESVDAGLTNNPIDVNLRSIVFCNGIKYGEEKQWNFTWQRYLSSDVATEKVDFMRALGCTNEMWLLSRYLNMSLDASTGIRKQDATRVIDAVSGNIYGHDIAFDFIRSRWPKLLKYFGGSSFTLSNLVKTMGSNMNSRFQVDELISFRDEHKGELRSASRAMEQAIEKGEAAIKWTENNFETIREFLIEKTRDT